MGYIALMCVSPKLQPNLFVSSTYSKQWVILPSWVWYMYLWLQFTSTTRILFIFKFGSPSEV